MSTAATTTAVAKRTCDRCFQKKPLNKLLTDGLWILCLKCWDETLEKKVAVKPKKKKRNKKRNKKEH